MELMGWWNLLGGDGAQGRMMELGGDGAFGVVEVVEGWWSS